MSKSEKVLEDLVAPRPGFAAIWTDERYLWTDDDGTFTPCGVFAAFSNYMTDVLTATNRPQVRDVFEYVEERMLDDEDVSTAAATCFLENLMNRVPEEIDPQTFVPLLGPESRAYSRAWDEFCGVRTE